MLEMKLVCCKGPDGKSAAVLRYHLEPAYHSRSQGKSWSPSGARARPRWPPTFTIAIAWILVMGTAGVIKAIVGGQSRDAEQGGQQDQGQQIHGVTQDGSTRVSWANWEEEKNKPIRGAQLWGAGDSWGVIHYEMEIRKLTQVWFSLIWSTLLL